MLGCQGGSRRPPASTSTRAAAIVVETGKILESVIRTVPLFVLIGCCAIIRWLKLCGTAVAPAILSEARGPGSGAGKMYRSLGAGVWPNKLAGTPKILPRTSLRGGFNQTGIRKV